MHIEPAIALAAKAMNRVTPINVEQFHRLLDDIVPPAKSSLRPLRQPDVPVLSFVRSSDALLCPLLPGCRHNKTAVSPPTSLLNLHNFGACTLHNIQGPLASPQKQPLI